MQLFNPPTPLVLLSNNRWVDGTWGAIGNHPVNVAVWGDYLEKLHFERHFFELDLDALLKLLWCPVQLPQVKVAIAGLQADQAIFL